MIFRYLALLLVTALLCGYKDGLGNPIPCTYCGCPTSGVDHTEMTDDNGKKYCGICHNWL